MTSDLRSVNDFDTNEGLRTALEVPGHTSTYVQVGRDFPKVAVGHSLDEAHSRDDDDMSVSSTPAEFADDLDWVLTNFNAEISQTQSLEEELKRLQVLKSYLILDSEREGKFERLTGLAARMFQVPICVVSLVDLGRVWFMSSRGLGDSKQSPRKFAFCAHTILSNQDLLVIPDATQDVRFKDNPNVAGPPYVRFYAGAPLICPEGYKLGTLCVVDYKVRPHGLSLEEKHTLIELAALVMDAMVERRREKHQILQDKSRIIAATAHDLLIPLSGVQMSLSLLSGDEELKSRLTESQKELLGIAGSCSAMMDSICHSAIETFRGQVSSHKSESEQNSANHLGPQNIVILELVKNLNMVMESYPKQVPLFITVDSLVPAEIVSEDLKIFRCTINLLTNACKKTVTGSVHLKIFVASNNKSPKLVFECEDTGPGVLPEHYQFLFRPFREIDTVDDDHCLVFDENGKDQAGFCRATMTNSGLGLYSVANQVSSLGGEYGFRPRTQTSINGSTPDPVHKGAIFWFSIPLILPKDYNEPNLRTSMVRPPSSDALPKMVRVLSTKNLDDAEAKHVFSTVCRVLADEKRHANSISSERKEGRPRRALVVDDSIVIRKSMGKALSNLGFDVTQAVNGLEGLKQLQSQVFDVVMCDFLMPVMDGLDCVMQYRQWEEIHRPWFKQYIVGISAHASTHDVEKGRIAGMNDFKPKPVTMKVLKELSTSAELLQISRELDKVLTFQEGEDQGTHAEKKVKTDHEDGMTGPLCLIAEDSLAAVNINMRVDIERAGWQAVFVSDGEDALRLLKIRNWDAVILDEEMSRLNGIQCIARFREWETENRVARQKYVYLMSTNYVPSLEGATATTTANLPSGLDGVLSKPVLKKDFVAVLALAASKITHCSDSNDILPR